MSKTNRRGWFRDFVFAKVTRLNIDPNSVPISPTTEAIADRLSAKSIRLLKRDFEAELIATAQRNRIRMGYYEGKRS